MRYVILMTFVFATVNGLAQENPPKLTIGFEGISISEALLKVEELSSYRFYFSNGSLGGKEKINRTFTDASIEIILEELFKDSNLNFHISFDKRIIITDNIFIYDNLPRDFFGKKNDSIATGSVANSITTNPVFYNPQNNVSNKRKSTVRIGKQNRNSLQEHYLLNGYVKNVLTNEPIVDLAIFIKDKKIGTTTNSEGFYSIRLPSGQNILETRAIGFQQIEQTVLIYSDGELNLSLNENVEQLDEVVVEANFAKNIKESTTGSTTIDSEESKNIPLVLGERNILKIAASLPSVSTAGEGATGFNVRGGKTDQNLVLLDDAVIFNPSHFFGIFQALNPFTTKEATIYTGSIPVQYGGRISSVFDIRTKSGSTTKFSGEASIGPVTGNLALEIPVIKDTSSIIIGGRGSYSDWLLKSLR